jgi:hypothetical protein
MPTLPVVKQQLKNNKETQPPKKGRKDHPRRNGLKSATSTSSFIFGSFRLGSLTTASVGFGNAVVEPDASALPK